MATASGHARIEHVVVLVLENRSFDHLMGFFPGAKGLRGDEFNLFDPSKDESDDNPRFTVRKDSPWSITQGQGPLHSVNATNTQLVGNKEGPTADNPVTNSGFVLSYREGLRTDHVHDPDTDTLAIPMRCFTPDRLPAINTLAGEFVLCDNWYCDVPGPTQPNRLFVHAATSSGFAHNVWSHIFDCRTIYNSLQEAGKTWAVYYADDNDVAKFSQLNVKAYSGPEDEAAWEADKAAGAMGGFFDFATFFAKHAADGSLPNYAFIEPAFGDSGQPEGQVNSMHAPHDVRPGDKLVADVYEALRANGELWAKTLFILTFDEHGGFYDHVVPPAAPNPDGLNSPPPGDARFAPAFTFDRLGLRVPTILVSPWLAKGQIDSTPYRHTSILAFAKKWFGLSDFLTRRDAAATSFDGQLGQLSAPRTDTPKTLPRPAVSVAAHAFAVPSTADEPLDDLLKEKTEGWFEIAQHLHDGKPVPRTMPKTQREAHEFIRDVMKRYANYKASKHPMFTRAQARRS
jgi:phospholipase C